jgi:hypothetical protein
MNQELPAFFIGLKALAEWAFQSVVTGDTEPCDHGSPSGSFQQLQRDKEVYKYQIQS